MSESPTQSIHTPTAQLLLRDVIQGEKLTYAQAYTVFSALSQGEFSQIETAALLGALHARGETAVELAGAGAAFKAAALPFPTIDKPLFEIVGTGGDGVGTINISTGAALTAASMGLAVAKHGNKAVSSKTGSADVISALGLKLDLTPQQSAYALEHDGFAFLFAQTYHSAMRFVAPVRNELKTPTIFNLLGPLINPAHISYQVMGVADASKLDMMAQAFQKLDLKRTLVINGLGLDEITVHGATSVREVTAAGIRAYEVTPEDLGVHTHDLTEMLGGNPQENAQILRDVFAGKGNPGHRDAIAVNTGALLYLGGKVSTLREGTQAALEQLASGKVATHLERMIRNCAAQTN